LGGAFILPPLFSLKGGAFMDDYDVLEEMTLEEAEACSSDD